MHLDGLLPVHPNNSVGRCQLQLAFCCCYSVMMMIVVAVAHWLMTVGYVAAVVDCCEPHQSHTSPSRIVYHVLQLSDALWHSLHVLASIVVVFPVVVVSVVRVWVMQSCTDCLYHAVM